MRWILAFILAIVCSFFASYFLPYWWVFAPIVFLIGIVIKPRASFSCGFLSIFALWFGWGFYLDVKNNSILSAKIAQILPLGGSSILLLLVAALLAAIIAGFAMMGGKLLVADRK